MTPTTHWHARVISLRNDDDAHNDDDENDVEQGAGSTLRRWRKSRRLLSGPAPN
ncbi:GH15322 [Drosophila grimshawi]|uniref:GH15322 n=1 Tax=Drosophila grimshawi TaxID=7222 RepID=B4IWK9_DROGR|nr:GH15322 [Drosophila grimshawi]